MEGWQAGRIIPQGREAGLCSVECSEPLDDPGEHLGRQQIVGVQVDVAVLAGVLEAPELFGVVLRGPVEPLATAAGLVGGVEVDQQVGMGEQPPHLRDEGVLLHHLPGVVAELAQGVDEGCLPGTAWADDGDAGSETGCGHGATFLSLPARRNLLERHAHKEPACFLRLAWQDGGDNDADVVGGAAIVEADGLRQELLGPTRWLRQALGS